MSQLRPSMPREWRTYTMNKDAEVLCLYGAAGVARHSLGCISNRRPYYRDRREDKVRLAATQFSKVGGFCSTVLQITGPRSSRLASEGWLPLSLSRSSGLRSAPVPVLMTSPRNSLSPNSGLNKDITTYQHSTSNKIGITTKTVIVARAAHMIWCHIVLLYSDG